jgi:hypothetical protein
MTNITSGMSGFACHAVVSLCCFAGLPDIERLNRKLEAQRASLADLCQLYRASSVLPRLEEALRCHEVRTCAVQLCSWHAVCAQHLQYPTHILQRSSSVACDKCLAPAGHAENRSSTCMDLQHPLVCANVVLTVLLPAPAQVLLDYASISNHCLCA